MAKQGEKRPVRITVEGHAAQICCRNCDRIMEEEPGSPNPKGYYLFRCRTCDSRVGVAVIALAAAGSSRETGRKFVSIVRLKEACRRLLPTNSTLREVVLSEKDILPSTEVVAKFEIFLNLLDREYPPRRDRFETAH